MAVFSEAEVQSALELLPLWRKVGEAIERSFEFQDFAAALRYVNEVAQLAEAANHHPDIDIRWNKVKLALSSHDAGGLTERDFRLATKIDQLPIGRE